MSGVLSSEDFFIIKFLHPTHTRMRYMLEELLLS
jgi:hypothetical protein